jgi:dephospho-CoA kinase
MSLTGRGAAALPLCIGLTGPIGCGKSTLARHLATRGGVVIDADDLARAVTVPGAATLPAIRARFGDGVFGADGTLDRAALAAVVFADPGALRDLEAIVHPAVRQRVMAALEAAAAARAAFVVIEAIKLVEGGLATACDEVWLVVCDRATQRSRLGARGGDIVDTERRLAAQGDLAERLAGIATRVMRSEGPLGATLAAADAALDAALDRRHEGRPA